MALKVVEKCVTLKKPFSVKMRVFEDEERTLDFVKKLELLGVSMLTVHGRTRK